MPNKTLLNIVNADPATPEELLSVKGMGQSKFELYGEELLLLLGLPSLLSTGFQVQTNL